MQWSNRLGGKPISASPQKVLSKEYADKTVLEFSPPRFDLGTPQQALEYLKEKSSGSDFRMSEPIRVQTGVDQIEQSSLEETIEIKALEKLKEIQEQAYQEAYNLGLEEGRAEAFNKATNEIKYNIENLEQLLATMKNLKTDLLSFNESHLLKLVFQMASRIATTEVQANQETIIEIIRNSVLLSQDEENVTVRVSPEQFEFLETLKKQTGREYEFLKKIRFEPNPEIAVGGCIVETNYGEIDARIEQRIEQLWKTVVESIPKVKDKIAG